MLPDETNAIENRMMERSRKSRLVLLHDWKFCRENRIHLEKAVKSFPPEDCSGELLGLIRRMSTVLAERENQLANFLRADGDDHAEICRMQNER